MRKSLVGSVALCLAIGALVGVPKLAPADPAPTPACPPSGPGPCPTLSPPAGQTAVKGGNVVTFGGQADPSATLDSAVIRAFDANGDPACFAFPPHGPHECSISELP